MLCSFGELASCELASQRQNLQPLPFRRFDNYRNDVRSAEWIQRVLWKFLDPVAFAAEENALRA
jgi:hypothetical protein